MMTSFAIYRYVQLWHIQVSIKHCDEFIDEKIGCYIY